MWNQENTTIKFTYVAVISEVFLACALYHLLQHLVVDVTQLERCSLRVESNPIKDMRKPEIINVNHPSGKRFSTVGLLFVFPTFGGAPDILSSFRDRWAYDRMIRVPEI